MSKHSLPKTIQIGISSCLLGMNVRFDGGHKKDRFICQTLGDYFEFIAVCPEVEVGLGVPRPTIRLIGDSKNPQVVGVKDPSIDITDKLKKYSEKRVKQFKTLSAYILKSKSPSCGMERVRVYQAKGIPSKMGVGVFAKALMQAYPQLPVEEEGRLNDPRLRENFIERIFIYRRWQELMDSGLTKQKLVAFHSQIKYTLMAHNVKVYQELGQMVANLANKNLKSLATEYVVILMQTLKRVASNKRHSNVLQHCLGYLKNSISKEDKQELMDAIDQYRLGFVPLIVPITLLKHHFRRFPNDYMSKQSYLNPYPREFMLRNMI